MPENTTLYLSGPSMIDSRLLDSFDSIQSYKGLSDDNNATGFELKMVF